MQEKMHTVFKLIGTVNIRKIECFIYFNNLYAITKPYYLLPRFLFGIKLYYKQYTS